MLMGAIATAARRSRALRFALLAAGLALSGAGAAQEQAVPYWASIKSGDAIAREGATMRAGPSQNMRALWIYRRPGLPVRVLAIHDDWRQIQEVDGTTGWMHRSLITGRRTAVVVGGEQVMRFTPSATGHVAYRVAQGVVGRLGACSNGFCAFDVTGRRGYIATSAIWGD